MREGERGGGGEMIFSSRLPHQPRFALINIQFQSAKLLQHVHHTNYTIKSGVQFKSFLLALGLSHHHG